MDFVNAVLNVVLFFVLLMLARDWLASLRADISATRADVVRVSRDLAETRVEVNQFNLEEVQHSTEDTQDMATLMREVRELRNEVKVMAKHDMALGEMVKILVKDRLRGIEEAKADALASKAKHESERKDGRESDGG